MLPPSDSDVIAVDGANGTKGITLANLATTILNKLSSKTYGLDQGTKTLPTAVNELYKSSVRNSAAGHNSIFLEARILGLLIFQLCQKLFKMELLMIYMLEII